MSQQGFIIPFIKQKAFKKVVLRSKIGLPFRNEETTLTFLWHKLKTNGISEKDGEDQVAPGLHL